MNIFERGNLLLSRMLAVPLTCYPRVVKHVIRRNWHSLTASRTIKTIDDTELFNDFNVANVKELIDKFNEDMSNSTFEYDYGFQAWTNNLQTDASNKHAYYAISTFIVLKSNEEISAASVLD